MADCKVEWKDFCVDPWTQAEELHNKGCSKRSKSYLYFHMMDQYHCFRTATGKWAVDFIGRVEHTNDDWAKVRDWPATRHLTNLVCAIGQERC